MVAAEPIALKRATPPPVLAALVEELGLDRDGTAFRCPAHDDENPSAGIFPATQVDPRGHGRWKCQACGARGDAIDLVARVWGLDPPAAMQWLAQNLERLPAARSSSHRRRRLRVDLIESAMTRTRSAARLASAFFADKGMDVDPAWAVRRFHIGALGRVLWLPYLEVSPKQGRTVPVGVTKRWRTDAGDWAKKSETGSRRRGAFYGPDGGREHVVICEGETDTIAVAWWLCGKPVDVLGMAGASLPLTKSQARRLRGRRVVLLPDADAAGRRWARRWSARLGQAGCAAVVVARLPAGEDAVTAGRTAVLAALRRAVRGTAPAIARDRGRGGSTTGRQATLLAGGGPTHEQ